MTPSQPFAAGTTRRQPRRFRPRPTEWAPVAATVFDQLDELGPMVERLHLIGARPGGTIGSVRAWACGPLPDGWVHDAGDWLGDRDPMLPVLRYRRTDGRPVELHRAAGWFGEELLPSGDDARAAMGLLGEMVGRHFDEGQILATPGSTGRYLLMRSLGRRTFPVLDADTQELIRSTSGQGRMELLPAPAGVSEVAQLVEYDGRLMYAGCVRELGHGVPLHDTSDEYAGYTRGRYRVTATVPAQWAHVGLLGVHDDGGGWRWPATPGESFTTWADAGELRLALDQGWRCTILERLLFPDHRGRPLDGWADRLVKIREGLLHRAAVGSISQEVGGLAAAAVRSIILHGIGALQGRPYKRTMTSTDAGDIPAYAGESWRVDGDVHTWAEGDQQAWAEMAHPEWAAAIWARARCRLLWAPTGVGSAPAGALTLYPENVVAMRTDALYLTLDPRWRDDRAVGRLRHRRTIDGPLPWPTTTRQLLDAKAAAVR